MTFKRDPGGRFALLALCWHDAGSVGPRDRAEGGNLSDTIELARTGTPITDSNASMKPDIRRLQLHRSRPDRGGDGTARRPQRAVRGRSDLQMDGRLRCGSLQTFHHSQIGGVGHIEIHSAARTVGQCFRAWARRPDHLGPPVFIVRWCRCVDPPVLAANPDGIAHIVDPPHGFQIAGGRGTYPSTINVKLTWEEERTSPITSYPIPIITGYNDRFWTMMDNPDSRRFIGLWVRLRTVQGRIRTGHYDARLRDVVAIAIADAGNHYGLHLGQHWNVRLDSGLVGNGLPAHHRNDARRDGCIRRNYSLTRAAPSQVAHGWTPLQTCVSMRGSISWDGNISISIHPRQWHASAANDNFTDGGHATQRMDNRNADAGDIPDGCRQRRQLQAIGRDHSGRHRYLRRGAGALQRDRYKPVTTGIRSGSAFAFLRYGHVGVSRSAILGPESTAGLLR